MKRGICARLSKRPASGIMSVRPGRRGPVGWPTCLLHVGWRLTDVRPASLRVSRKPMPSKDLGHPGEDARLHRGRLVNERKETT